jgi:predicted nucleic-acid-binding protein
MRAVDTNLLVRLLTRDDPKQVAAAERFVAHGAWVSHLVLAEATWVLDAVYERSAAQIATGVEMLLNHQHLSLQDADVITAAVGHFRQRPALGFSDCLIVEIARKAGHLPLGSFDRRLAKIDGVEKLRADPADTRTKGSK